MQLSVFEPSNGLSLREAVNRLFEDSFVRGERSSHMPVDVLETQEAVIVKAVIPGSSKDQLQVNYEKELLTIRAEVPADNPPEGGRILLRERSHGTLSRSFRLPFAINADAASAEYQDGVLTLTLPKQESVKPRSIHIN